MVNDRYIRLGEGGGSLLVLSWLILHKMPLQPFELMKTWSNIFYSNNVSMLLKWPFKKIASTVAISSFYLFLLKWQLEWRYVLIELVQRSGRGQVSVSSSPYITINDDLLLSMIYPLPHFLSLCFCFAGSGVRCCSCCWSIAHSADIEFECD